jgi:hypothetical protein
MLDYGLGVNAQVAGVASDVAHRIHRHGQLAEIIILYRSDVIVIDFQDIRNLADTKTKTFPSFP